MIGHPGAGAAGSPARMTIVFDGRPVDGWAGDTVASALWRAGVRALGRSPGGGARGLSCGIGHCFTCRVTVDGVPGIRACLVPIRPGMRVEPEDEDGTRADAG